MKSGRVTRQSGQGLIEFAVILPLFAFLLGAVIDGGAAMGRYNTLSNAAKEGARMAAVTDPNGAATAIAEIRTRVKSAAGGLLDGVNTNCGPKAPSICVEWTAGPTLGTPPTFQEAGELGSSVRVRVKYDYAPMMIGQFGAFTIETCAIQRVERPVVPPPSKSSDTGCG